MKNSSLVLLSIGLFTLKSMFLPTRAEAAPKKPLVTKIIVSKNDPETIKAEGWHLPHPPFPAAAVQHHEQGRFYVVITTGANGRAAKVSVPKSKNHPNLDLGAAKWAYAQWSGPPNHQMVVPVAYTIR